MSRATQDIAIGMIADAVAEAPRDRVRLRIGVVTALENVGNKRVKLDIFGDSWVGQERSAGLHIGDRAIALQQHAITVVIGRLTGIIFGGDSSETGGYVWTGVEDPDNPLAEVDTASANDVYFQANGDFWTFDGTTWTNQGSLVGPEGPPGDDGADGAPGSVWYAGSGTPSGGLGITGDYYLRTNGDVYMHSSGIWNLIMNITGPTGSTGPAGADGSEWFSGTSAPGGGTPVGAVNGDFYLRTTNGDVYKMIAGSWGLPIMNLTGPTGSAGAAGAPGALWYSGSGAPAGGTGINGDYYLDTANGDVYTKSGGSWGSAVGNIKGATGSTGSTGATGAAGSVWYAATTAPPTGGSPVDGDWAVVTSIVIGQWNVYQRQSGAWVLMGNIKGATGSTGATGPEGGGTSTIVTASGDDRTLDLTAGSNFNWFTGWGAGTKTLKISGTTNEGKPIYFTWKDAGTSRSLVWTATDFRAMTGVTLPGSSTINKRGYLEGRYNAVEDIIDVVGVWHQP